MSKLCEAFNRINSKFGANRVKVLYLDSFSIRLQIAGWGMFNIHLTETLDCEVNECFWPVGQPRQIKVYRTPNSQWLTAIANGKVRDEAGNMIDPENQVSNKSKVWPEAC
jgi:hypothetical protein